MATAHKLCEALHNCLSLMRDTTRLRMLPTDTLHNWHVLHLSVASEEVLSAVNASLSIIYLVTNDWTWSLTCLCGLASPKAL